MGKNHVILLMITDHEKWHYLTVKKIICNILENNIKT